MVNAILSLDGIRTTSEGPDIEELRLGVRVKEAPADRSDPLQSDDRATESRESRRHDPRPRPALVTDRSRRSPLSRDARLERTAAPAGCSKRPASHRRADREGFGDDANLTFAKDHVFDSWTAAAHVVVSGKGSYAGSYHRQRLTGVKAG
jgi:hypothetical protein